MMPFAIGAAPPADAPRGGGRGADKAAAGFDDALGALRSHAHAAHGARSRTADGGANSDATAPLAEAERDDAPAAQTLAAGEEPRGKPARRGADSERERPDGLPPHLLAERALALVQRWNDDAPRSATATRAEGDGEEAKAGHRPPQAASVDARGAATAIRAGAARQQAAATPLAPADPAATPAEPPADAARLRQAEQSGEAQLILPGVKVGPAAVETVAPPVPPAAAGLAQISAAGTDAGEGGAARDDRRQGARTSVEAAGRAPRAAPSPAAGETPPATAQMLPAAGAPASFANALVSHSGWSQAVAAAPATPAPETPARMQTPNALSIQLRPLELGPVTAHLRYVGQQLTIDVEVETAAAHQRLSSDSDEIAKSLQSLGFHVEKINVRHVQPTPQPAERDAAAGNPGAGGQDSASGMSRHPDTDSGARSGREHAHDGNTQRTERVERAAGTLAQAHRSPSAGVYI